MNPLHDVSRLDKRTARDLGARLHELGLDLAFIRRHTERGGDDLRSALKARRDAAHSNQPAFLALRLLFCGERIAEAEARSALGDDLFAAAHRTGLLIPGEPAPFHLRTAGGLYLLSDYLDTSGQGATDAVMGAGETTAILWRAARPTHPVDSALDLGCGAGTLALLLAAHATRVTGTDINPRAVAIARFNAALNGIENAEFHAGSLYEPIQGRNFDMIVSQPPYYPRRAGGVEGHLTFLHGGEDGDEIAKLVVAGVPAHLAPGGRAFVFSSWPDGGEEIAIAGHNVLTLTTNRRELTSSHQSLMVIESGSGWTASRAIAPECWGEVSGSHVGRMIAAEQWLRGGEAAGGSLRLADGARVFEEGGQRFVDLPLFGVSAVDEALWESIGNPQAGSELTAEAVRRGLLECEDISQAAAERAPCGRSGRETGSPRS